MATSIKNLSEYDKANISNGADYKIGIVVSEWNESITSKLLDGALQTFRSMVYVMKIYSLKVFLVLLSFL